MRNAKLFEKMITDADYLEALKTIGEKQSKDILAVIDNESLKEKVETTNGSPDALFDVVHEHFHMERLQKIIAIEQDAFQRSSSYETLFVSSVTPAINCIGLMRSLSAITLLCALDPHMLAVSKNKKKLKTAETGVKGNVTFPSGRAEYVVLKGEMKVRVWRIKSFGDDTDFGEWDSGLECDEPIILKAGDRLRQADFESLEHLAHSEPCLYLYTQMGFGSVPVDISVNTGTGKINGVSAANPLSSRLQMQATLLRMLGRVDAYGTLAELLDNEAHFVRWHVMRELLVLDKDRTLPRLREMSITDPQPAVRRAAEKTLQMIKSKTLTNA